MFDFGSLFSGIGSFLGGQAEEKGYNDAANFYGEAAQQTLLGGRIKDIAALRTIDQYRGNATAVAGANGVRLSGSALDVIHSNTQQGFLSKAITDLNTQNEYRNYLAQQSQAKDAADAAGTKSILGAIGGVLGFFSDDRLKEDVQFITRRGDGIGIYHFRYRGSDTVYEGVMAHEVALFKPEALVIAGEYASVNYAILGIPLKEVEHA